MIKKLLTYACSSTGAALYILAGYAAQSYFPERLIPIIGGSVEGWQNTLGLASVIGPMIGVFVLIASWSDS